MKPAQTDGPRRPRRPRSNPDARLEQVLLGGHLLHQVASEFSAVLNREFGALGLTAQQAGLLLRSAPRPTSPNQLAPLIGTDTAGMTRLLDRLEVKGLVTRQRHPKDRRSVVIEVTDEGRVLVPQLPPIFGRVNAGLMAGFTDDEVHQVVNLLQRMLDNLRAAAGPSGPGDPSAKADRLGGPR